MIDESRRVTYDCGIDGNAVFIPKCEKCGRFVKPDHNIFVNGLGLKEIENGTCSRCGRTYMLFEGFF